MTDCSYSSHGPQNKQCNGNPVNVLIIDDDETLCSLLGQKVTRMGHDVTSAFTIQEGVRNLSSQDFDIVFLDVLMPDGNGLDALLEIQNAPCPPEVIIMTGMANPDNAEFAIKNGAWDYIEKPFSIEAMALYLNRALQYRMEERSRKFPSALQRERIIGKSSQMTDCLDLIAEAANTSVNTLLLGETGTGKELFAEAIHENSSRAKKSFVVVDCSALPEPLVESILFGHEKGAFTGADKPRHGLIKQADGGTLFLDEVGELSLPLQKAFLRILQEHRFRPLGSHREMESDFRLVAATNKSLDDMAKSGQFREDLLFRLSSFTIEVPPLRRRLEDIEEIATYYLERLCKKYDMQTKKSSSELIGMFRAYTWPGNVRELINALESALIVARHSQTLFPKHLPDNIRIHVARSSFLKETPTELHSKQESNSSDTMPNLKYFRQGCEKIYLHYLLSFAQGNIGEACHISGLSRSRLYGLMKHYNKPNLP